MGSASNGAYLSDTLPDVVPLGTHKKQVELLRNAWWVTQKDVVKQFARRC